MTAVMERAHERVGRQRVAIQRTQPIAVEEIPSADEQAADPAQDEPRPQPSQGR
jgi:hypothetical protein